MIHRITQMLTYGLSVFLLANAAVITNAAAEPAHDARFWWPERLDLTPLRETPASANPYGADFDYRKAFQSLDLVGVKADIKTALTSSQPWWPADYGNYGPFFIRMAWHSAGTYRVQDGRGGGDGGQQRFEPLNSWPDNANLDKARRLLWPVKQKYGRNLSWGDLMVLAGNVAMESMGFPTYGFAGGRADDWTPDTVYWGASKFMDSNRDKDGKLSGPVAAVQMGLIYVNPEGPNGNHDPVSAAKDIREAFGRMAMNDEETVALIAGGHTFGKAHGAHPPKECTGPVPAAESVEKQGFGWHNKCGKGSGADTVTSGLEGAWTSDPVKFTSQYLDNLLNLEWIKTESPAGATQWKPKDDQAPTTPDAHDPAKTRPLMMLTTDIALKEDPAYRKIVETFAKDPEAYKKAFGKAWFKLTHRDMGPRARYLGADVPNESFPWQDPVPALESKAPDAQAIKDLKNAILKAGIDQADLIRAAWASAASYRETDHRGGTNGGRIRLSPQKDWKVNDPESLAKTLAKLETVREEFNKGRKDNVRISMADIIVLGGTAAAEAAAKKAGISFIEFPFTPGRADALQTQTDPASFAVLEPKADAFRNYFTEEAGLNPGEAMIERAAMLHLTVPEMTALIGGLRVLNANAGGSSVGVLTKTPGTLDNAFFVNLLDMKCEWKKSGQEEGLYEAFDRTTGKQVWKATTADLLFGSHSELRAVAEAYASSDGKEQFVQDFARAWGKVMNLGRYDL